MGQGVRKFVSIPVFATTQCNGNEPGFDALIDLGSNPDSRVTSYVVLSKSLICFQPQFPNICKIEIVKLYCTIVVRVRGQSCVCMCTV